MKIGIIQSSFFPKGDHGLWRERNGNPLQRGGICPSFYPNIVRTTARGLTEVNFRTFFPFCTRI